MAATEYTKQLGKLAIPPKDGLTATVPPKPDYHQESSWAAIPFSENVPADVFYIHPTTNPVSGYHGCGIDDLKQVGGRSSWNQAYDDEKTQNWTRAIALDQTSVFAGDCRIYVPFYRQASIFTLQQIVLGDAAWGLRVLAIAYSDIERAFRHFIDVFNRGRPFFIAGHSQGSIHGLRLLREQVSETDLAARLAGAYLIGIDISPDDLTTMPDIPLCVDAGCPKSLVVYKCWRHGVTPDVPKDNCNVNPDDWGYDENATPQNHRKVYIENGALQIEASTDLELFDWQGDVGNLHAHDYSLFREQLQANVHEQLVKMLKRKSGV